MNKLRELFFGHPWIYYGLRPLLMGGFDFTRVYRWLETDSEDVIIDIGCGFGATLEHVQHFREYHGFDTSERGIATIKKRFPDARVHLYNRTADSADFQRIQPTKAVLMGLLHHLSDPEAIALLGMLQQTPSLRRSITEDPVFIPGRWINNLLAWLDRGRHVRYQDHHESLIRSAGLQVSETLWCPAGNGCASYLCLGLLPE